MRIGILGLDTAHVFLYAGLLNDPSHPAHVPGAKVVAAWPGGSPDWALSQELLGKQLAWIKEVGGIEVLDSPSDVLKRVDAVMLLSLDGRVHLRQFEQVAPFRKPTYVNKPFASSLEEARALAALAAKSGTPVFSSSSLRYSSAMRREAAQAGILSAEASGPAGHETGQPGLFWYGIHMAEMLFTMLGPGVESVAATGSADFDLVAGIWKGGRSGILRGFRGGDRHGFSYAASRPGGVSGGAAEADDAANSGLVRAMLDFFRSGVSPVPVEETLELIAYLEAANLSLKKGS